MSFGWVSRTTGQQTPRQLDTVGNGTGTTNAIGNYAGAAQNFSRIVSPPFVFEITLFQISIADSGGIAIGGYGGMAALTNGIVLQFQTGGQMFTSGVSPIKNNMDYIKNVQNFRIDDFTAGGKVLSAQFNFVQVNGSPLVLYGVKNDFIRVVLNDDFSGLDFHYFTIVSNVRM